MRTHCHDKTSPSFKSMDLVEKEGLKMINHLCNTQSRVITLYLKIRNWLLTPIDKFNSTDSIFFFLPNRKQSFLKIESELRLFCSNLQL